MSEVCGDNRFELIGEFKGELIEGTNIEASPEEMAVLDNILFRIWQMGWLDKLKAMQGNGWQIEKRNCDNVQKTDLVCACGAPVLYDQILFPDGHTANRLFCSACGLSMRSPENDADGEWLKGRWAETVAAKTMGKVDTGAGVVKELERVIVDATYPDRPRGFMMPLELAERVLAALKVQESPTNAQISSAIECLLHPQDADDSDMAKAIDTAVCAMKSLKAQEPKPPIIKENSYGWKFYYCPSCGKEFYQNNKFSFCEKCGQAVKWE